MSLLAIRFCLRSLADLFDEGGQDITEYALSVAMVALVAVAGLESLANGITHTFTVVSTTLGQHLH